MINLTLARGVLDEWVVRGFLRCLYVGRKAKRKKSKKNYWKEYNKMKNNIIKEIKQAITYGQWSREGKITKEENKLLMEKLLEGESS